MGCFILLAWCWGLSLFMWQKFRINSMSTQLWLFEKVATYKHIPVLSYLFELNALKTSSYMVIWREGYASFCEVCISSHFAFVFQRCPPPSFIFRTFCCSSKAFVENSCRIISSVCAHLSFVLYVCGMLISFPDKYAYSFPLGMFLYMLLRFLYIVLQNKGWVWSQGLWISMSKFFFLLFLSFWIREVVAVLCSPFTKVMHGLSAKHSNLFAQFCFLG